MFKSKLDGKSKVKEIVYKLLLIIVGNALCSIAFNVFFSPNKLLSGGIGGISLMLQYLKGIPSGVVMLILNIPIYIVGYKMIDRDFAFYSLISTFIFSGLLTAFQNLSGVIEVNDMLVGAVAGGVLNGLGMGIVFRSKASQGGLDIIATILKRKYNMNISTGLMMLNTVIISLSSILFGVIPAVYTLMSMYIAYAVVDRVQVGLNIRKSIMVITDKYLEIGDEIIKELDRGVTYIEAEGGYSHNKKKMVYCIVLSKEVIRLKEIVNEIDPAAFVTITDVTEVEGRGFHE